MRPNKQPVLLRRLLNNLRTARRCLKAGGEAKVAAPVSEEEIYDQG
jgi:hypothetical protein